MQEPFRYKVIARSAKGYPTRYADKETGETLSYYEKKKRAKVEYNEAKTHGFKSTKNYVKSTEVAKVTEYAKFTAIEYQMKGVTDVDRALKHVLDTVPDGYGMRVIVKYIDPITGQQRYISTKVINYGELGLLSSRVQELFDKYEIDTDDADVDIDFQIESANE